MVQTAWKARLLEPKFCEDVSERLELKRQLAKKSYDKQVKPPSLLVPGQPVYNTLALLKAQVSLQLGNVSSSDNGASLSIMYSYTYIAYG